APLPPPSPRTIGASLQCCTWNVARAMGRGGLACRRRRTKRWSGLFGVSRRPLTDLIAAAVGVGAHPRSGLVVGGRDRRVRPIHLTGIGGGRVVVRTGSELPLLRVAVAALPSGPGVRVGPTVDLRAGVRAGCH